MWHPGNFQNVISKYDHNLKPIYHLNPSPNSWNIIAKAVIATHTFTFNTQMSSDVDPMHTYIVPIIANWLSLFFAPTNTYFNGFLGVKNGVGPEWKTLLYEVLVNLSNPRWKWDIS
jgi:hypothetical protein